VSVVQELPVASAILAPSRAKQGARPRSTRRVEKHRQGALHPLLAAAVYVFLTLYISRRLGVLLP